MHAWGGAEGIERLAGGRRVKTARACKLRLADLQAPTLEVVVAPVPALVVLVRLGLLEAEERHRDVGLQAGVGLGCGLRKAGTSGVSVGGEGGVRRGLCVQSTPRGGVGAGCATLQSRALGMCAAGSEGTQQIQTALPGSSTSP